MKRTLSFLIVLAMMLGMLGVVAQARVTIPIATTEYTFAECQSDAQIPFDQKREQLHR